jgi:hypothetical protein
MLDPDRGGPVTEALHLPSTGPDPIPGETALAAVLGYARGKRPLFFRAPNARAGRWVEIAAFGYERFDRRPDPDVPLGEPDILISEGLHGRLDRPAWTAMKALLHDIRPLADAAVARAAGRPYRELPDDQFSVLAEPGTVGAALRDIWQFASETPGGSPKHVTAALHHRRPSLFPLLTRTTRWQLLPHVREEDSGVEAVIHREVLANRPALGMLQDRVTALLDDDGPRLTVLRLHDILLWLSAGQRMTHAVKLGRATREWAESQDAAVHPGARPV